MVLEYSILTNLHHSLLINVKVPWTYGHSSVCGLQLIFQLCKENIQLMKY